MTRLLLATLVLVAMIGGLVTAGASAQSGTYDLDENTGLTDDETIAEYEESGNVTVETLTPDMSFQIASDSESVGVSGIQYTDFDTTYLRVSHDEEIERTVRFYVPESYWHPHPAEIESVDGETTATFEAAEGNMTAVSIHFEGEQDAVFPVKRQASAVFSVRDSVSDWWGEETGTDLPQLSGGGGQWEYIPTSELSGTPPTFAIKTKDDEPAIQYDAANSSDPAGKEWRPVPDCESSAGEDAAVCTFDRGGDDTIYVMAQQTPAPDIRYKYDASVVDRLRGAVPAVPEAFGDFINDVRETIDELLS